MALNDLGSEIGEGRSKGRDQLVGVYIAILAVILAICSLGGGNAAQEATLKTVEASNTWAFFQAKNVRRQAYRLQLADFEAALLANPQMPEDARKHYETKVADYKAQEKRLTSEPETKEGLDELFQKAKGLEAERSEALSRGPYFDDGQALLQIAIVLASVAIISTGSLPLIASIVVGVLGAIATVGGFTLAFPLPFAA